MISPTQREIIEALIELYEKKKETVKGEDISAVLHRTPGTIRNQMQTLKALGYVDGVPGPKGGYIPAMKAYEALELEMLNKPHIVNIFRDGKPIEGVTVQKIEFTSVQNPDECMSRVTIVGDTRKIMEHDIIKVGPTPANHIILTGEVVGRDDIRRELRIASHSISSIPKGKVIEIAAKNVISFSPETKLKECAKILIDKRIRAAPVIKDGKLLGIITETEIVRAYAAGNSDRKAGDVAIKNPLTIDGEARLIEAIERMTKYDVGRLIVTKGEKIAGMITKTDILIRMLK
jgi:predicted transcriptional regulator